MTSDNTDRATQRDIRDTVHHLDRRVTVLEERSKAQAEDMKKIHTDIDQNNKLISNVAMELKNNRIEDMQDRDKSRKWTIATLVSVLVAVVLLLLQISIG